MRRPAANNRRPFAAWRAPDLARHGCSLGPRPREGEMRKTRGCSPCAATLGLRAPPAARAHPRIGGGFRSASARADRTHLQAISPINLTAQIQAPILLMASTLDTVVLITQSRAMADRMRASGKRVTLVEMPGDDHCSLRQPAACSSCGKWKRSSPPISAQMHNRMHNRARSPAHNTSCAWSPSSARPCAPAIARRELSCRGRLAWLRRRGRRALLPL